MAKILQASLLMCIGLFIGVSVNAQSCRGSYVTYIIRDAAGKPLDAASSRITFEGGESRASQKWKVSLKEFARQTTILPPAVAALNGQVSGLTTSQFCNFPEPASVKVTLDKKTMELTFKFPRMGEQESADFVVDSMPFKAGKYVIELAVPKDSGEYYGAKGWKKVP